MKNIKLLLVSATIVFTVGCKNQTPTEATELAVPVSVESVKKQSIQQFINTTGTAKAGAETILNSEISGNYQLLKNPKTGKKFKLGDSVKKGQTIIHIEDKEYLNSIAIESKKLNLEISEHEYEKSKSLYDKGGVTLRELRNAELSSTNAKYDYESAEIRLSKMDILASFSGIIVNLPYYTEGGKVTANQPMVELMNYKKMHIDINLPEKNLGEIKIGQEVIITSYTLTDDTIIGVVNELSPIISTETRTFSGKLQIDNNDLKLRPGMFVKANIITAQKDSVIIIPKKMILSGNRGKYVFVVGRNSSADDRRIVTGIENQDNIEVLEGLKPNDRLIIKGFETLRDGSKVKVIL